MAKLSIVTINFNNKEGLRRTIESVLNQKSVDFDYIVIDGGSTDGSQEVILDYSSRLTRWVSEPDKGIYNAMNKGISLATTEYINFINSGDIINGDFALAFVNKIINQNSSLIDDRSIFVLDCLTLKNDIASLVRGDKIKSKSDTLSTFLPHPSTFYNKKSFYIVSRFNENNFIVSDYEWYMRALFLEKFRIVYFPFCYSIFYQNGISSINSANHKNEFNEVKRAHFTNFQVKIFSSRKYKYFKNFVLIKHVLSFFNFDTSVQLIRL